MDIAYQVFGDGPVDLLVLPGPNIPIDSIDAEPSMYRFHRRLASFSRVIRLDQRGIGFSSRVPSVDLVGPKFWAEDAIAVMDAAGSERATIFAPSYTAMTALVLAADYPDRVRSLVIVNGGARTLWAPDYPFGAEPTRAEPFMTVGMETDAIERGFDFLEFIAPSVADDDAFRAWWDVAGNRAASPHGPCGHHEDRGVRRPRHTAPHHRADTDPASGQLGLHSRRARPLPRRAHRGLTVCGAARRRCAVLGRRHRPGA